MPGAVIAVVLYGPIFSPRAYQPRGAQPPLLSSQSLRLTHLKLAGFKSFVDPTTIDVPSQLVGVVGPNGCGKSNIIDAVRWVLGETRASALRGESMQDVIFNGSALRNPVGRASVELVFGESRLRRHEVAAEAVPIAAAIAPLATLDETVASPSAFASTRWNRSFSLPP